MNFDFIILFDKSISKEDLNKHINMLSKFNNAIYDNIVFGILKDVPILNKNYFRITCSDQYKSIIEGFTLNLSVLLIQNNHNHKILSEIYDYGSKDSWDIIFANPYTDNALTINKN